jgi:uncharacterized membrane protein YjdF
MVGGKYTYAEVPLFNVLRDAFHGARNEYDTASRDSKNNLKYYSALSFDL